MRRRSRHRPAWVTDRRTRRRFERGARGMYPSLSTNTRGRERGSTVTYSVTADVPHYEARTITMVFLAGTRRPRLLRVVVDGPDDSRHRYRGGGLCMWYPRDPPEQRWTQGDGLLTLIEHTRLHLFREAWARETGEWLGPEAPHGDPRVDPTA